MAQIVQRLVSSDPVIELMTSSEAINTVIGLDTSDSNKFKINVGTGIVDASTFELTDTAAKLDTTLDVEGNLSTGAALKVATTSIYKVLSLLVQH